MAKKAAGKNVLLHSIGMYCYILLECTVTFYWNVLLHSIGMYFYILVINYDVNTHGT
jgi:hypothetical protein